MICYSFISESLNRIEHLFIKCKFNSPSPLLSTLKKTGFNSHVPRKVNLPEIIEAGK